MSATRNRAGHDGGWRARVRARLFVQSLENRLTPAQFVVTSSADSGAGSLRAAIASSNTNGQADTITFNPAVTTINLTTGQLTISEGKDLLIDGGGKVTINGAAAASATNRIFQVSPPAQPAVRLAGMTLANCKNTSSGGAIFTNSGARLTLSHCDLRNNSVQGSGGAVAIYGGTFVASHCIFDHNSAGPVSLSVGGAISASIKAVVELDRCTISDNSAPGGIGSKRGGGICVEQSKLTMTDSLVINNQAPDSYGSGVEIYNSTAAIANCTIAGNTGGPAIDVYNNSTATLTNCTIANNSHIGIVVASPTIIRSCTIAGNTAFSNGGGITFEGNVELQIDSTIVASNFTTSSSIPSSQPDIGYTSSNLIKGSNNLIGNFNVTLAGQNNLVGNSKQPLNPGLLPLANYGGANPTFALSAGSPAINAGSVIAGITTDQRGYLRTYGSAPDIGAYEAQPPRVAAVVINDGSAQRSRVTSVTVNFDSPVAIIPNAFRLQRQSNGQFVDLLAVVSSGTPTTSVSLSFSGALTEFGSLKDGRYTLTVLGNEITNFVGKLDGNADGVPGDDYVLIGAPANGLFRLFGDSEGDGYVGASDLIAFRLSLGGTGITFDFNNNGSVDASDFAHFRTRFGNSI